VSNVEYGYRFYDHAGCVGPLTREQVLAKLRDDNAVFPVERRAIAEGRWSGWADSDDLLCEIARTPGDAEEATQ
jgi:hypothetical protein